MYYVYLVELVTVKRDSSELYKRTNETIINSTSTYVDAVEMGHTTEK